MNDPVSKVMKTFSAICEFFKLSATNPDFNLQNLTTDSRIIAMDDAFCAYKGETHDGHDYIQTAIDKGAKLILAQHHQQSYAIPVLIIPNLREQLSSFAAWFYDQPSEHLKIIGVTGTNGKSSTTHYLAQFLHLLGHKVGVLGSLGRGLWGALLNSDLNTPNAVDLQRQLAAFVALKVEYVCMEVSSHGIAQGRIENVNFLSAVFTNLTQDHLDFHHSMDEYANIKAQFFAWPKLKTIILNKDDSEHKRMLAKARLDTKIYYYSLIDHDDAIIYANQLNLSLQGLSFELHSIWGKATIQTALLGAFNASNILAALTTLLSLGFPLQELAKLSILLNPVKGRMEVLRYPQLPLIVIDYAHTPDALEKVLFTLKAYERPLWVVFGCGGDRDSTKRPKMAAIAEALANHVIVTEDNSRFEAPQKIFADIFTGFMEPKKVILIPERRQAIHYVLHEAPKEAIILLVGKGHETYLDTQGQKIHFDEREVIQALS